MKKIILSLLFLMLILGLTSALAESQTALPLFEGKPRLLITQDGEVDDMNSLIHTLLYANDVDLEGIVQSSSKLHYSGNGADVPPLRWMGTDWMNKFLDAYAEVYPNLVVHDADYPAPDKLREITKVGNIKAEADTSEATEGSDLIKARILAEDPRPLFLVVGGGANTVARALMDIEAEFKGKEGWEALYERICENVILTAWGMQDSCYMDYIQPNWPRMRMIDVSASTMAYGYRWANLEVLSAESLEKMSSSWMETHLEKSHGPLLDLYVTWGDGTYLEGEEDPDQYGVNEDLLNNEETWVGHAYQRYDFLSEGDSPAWFLTVPNGLRSAEDLAYGGWAGAYARFSSVRIVSARVLWLSVSKQRAALYNASGRSLSAISASLYRNTTRRYPSISAFLQASPEPFPAFIAMSPRMMSAAPCEKRSSPFSALSRAFSSWDCLLRLRSALQ